jgi:hypothetical protein
LLHTRRERGLLAYTSTSHPSNIKPWSPYWFVVRFISNDTH